MSTMMILVLTHAGAFVGGMFAHKWGAAMLAKGKAAEAQVITSLNPSAKP